MPLVKLLTYIIILFSLVACEDAAKTDMPPWQPDTVENSTVIKVALRVNPASYYWQDGHATGFDYKLLQSFANHTHTKIKIIPVLTAVQAIGLLKERKVDMAAGALSPTQAYTEHFEISEPYYQSEQYMIYRHPDTNPRNFGEIPAADIDVGANPNHIELLEKLAREHNGESTHPNLDIKSDDANDYPWYLHPDTPSHKLIEMVNLGLIRYTLADAYELSATQFLYPYVKIAFAVSENTPVVWLFNREPANPSSQHLVYLANDLFSVMQENGELARITKSHPEHFKLLPYADKLTFIESGL